MYFAVPAGGGGLCGKVILGTAWAWKKGERVTHSCPLSLSLSLPLSLSPCLSAVRVCWGSLGVQGYAGQGALGLACGLCVLIGTRVGAWGLIMSSFRRIWGIYLDFLS